ncbi:MAG: VCBS repeat-containing protein [Bacteroidales bacterium]|nr:VCBS repeat-containing protein [Bacteroidales bacterium]
MCRSLYIVIIFTWLAGMHLLTGCTSGSRDKHQGEKSDQVEADSAEIAKSRAILSCKTLGLAYLEENKLEKAEAEFKKLIMLAPGEALGYANLGIVYMRMGNYNEAEEQLKKGVEINPEDPEIRLNLASVYNLTHKEKASREELEKSLEIDPDHVQALYSLAESYQDQSDDYSIKQWKNYLQKIVETTPSNLVSRLYLIEALIDHNNADEALMNLEQLERISPSFPDEAIDYYNAAVQNLHASNYTEALTSVLIFHNFLKLTHQYQKDIQQLRGGGTSRFGTPVISFSESRPAFLMEGESLLDAIQFTDVSSSAGLNNLSSFSNSCMVAGDMDRDGDEDIYVAGTNPEEEKHAFFLLRNNMGRFIDISGEAGIRHKGVDAGAIFADYNNDGFLDLYITKEEANLLYDNVSEGNFQEVSIQTGVGDEGAGNCALFFDMDQEGDLDLFLLNQNSTKMYRNNGNQAFQDVTDQVEFGDKERGGLDALFEDLDDDGDVDLVIINEKGIHKVYTNLRKGTFAEITEESGLKNRGGSKALDAGDYNNDGFPDLFIAGGNGNCSLYQNNGDGTFKQDLSSEESFSKLKGSIGHDALFLDFDNDGFQDILFVGEPEITGGQGIYLFHNNNRGQFEDVSFLLPEEVHSGSQAVITDYNEDGDMDILIAGIEGGIHLLRNDGGNANHHLKIQLVGLRAGSGKNNYFGIGAKVEMRAGELYQMKTVTQPNVHFGLGTHEKVDLVRILWTNGVPQNIFSPGSDQDLIEEQELKGSCPFLYTWDGEKYEFLKDIMWRSALGMPLGIMGGSVSYAFANASEEYLKIPGEYLKSSNRRYSIQVTAELWETIYFDKIRLLTIDHPESIDIYVDERFSVPPFPDFRIYHVREKKTPRSVVDGSGLDLHSFITDKDNRYISNLRPGKFQGITEMHDLIIDLGDFNRNDDLHLFLNGWIFPTDASINVAIAQSGEFSVKSPCIQVMNETGHWETVVENIGFPMGKNKTVIVDLSGKIPANDHRIRIRTNMEIYWDYIFYATGDVNGSDHLQSLSPFSSDLHYRGFSEKYQKGGRYGPHWFDYEKVSGKAKWRDLTGHYTRYGDVNSLLMESDNQYIIMNAGDEVTIDFDVDNLPGVPVGWKRDFILYSVGWVKDGDLNTATGHTVEPLPFHGMHAYPYADGEQYPASPDLQKYMMKYNTRTVSNEAFRDEIRKTEYKKDP